MGEQRPLPLLLALTLLALLTAVAGQSACASGTSDAGGPCPPDDSNGPCPPGCETSSSGSTSSSSSAEDAITCDTYPTESGFGIQYPCGYANGIYSDSQALAYPTELSSGTSGALAFTLTVEAYRLDATMFEMNARGYCYAGSCAPIGPTIRVKPGDTLTITLINDLGTEADTQDGKALNTMRHPNMTNVHTHGLHIDPAVDNVMVHAGPGETLTYVYTIPEDHMIGTHWYHSHNHGSSALQVMGGMVGALIVEPTATVAASLPAAYSAMSEHLLVLTHVSLCTCNPTQDPFRIIDYQEYRSSTGDAMSLNAVVGSEGISDVYLTNGQYQPSLSVSPGEWVRFELVNAVGDTYVEIELRDSVTLNQKGLAAGCQLKLLALDGVFLHSGVRSPYDDVVLLHPASRASLAVMCSTAGTRYLQTNPMGRAADYEVVFLQNLLTLVVAGAPVSMDTPAWGVDDIARPYYLQSLLGTAPTAAASVWETGVEQTAMVGGAAWVGVGTDCKLSSTGRDDSGQPVDPNTYGSCPYVAFGYPESETSGRSMENYVYRHVGKVCDVEDLVLQGRGATPHPMHIHVNHFQVVEYLDCDGNDAANGRTYPYWGEIGDWRDTMGALTGSLRVRYVLDKYGGNIMMHCHFLMHEDVGMMDRIWVEPATADDSLRCTASCTNGAGTCGDNPSFCSLSGSDYSHSAFDDAYPSVVSSCNAEVDTCANVVCEAASDVCHVQGTCSAGSCSVETNAEDGTSCDDGNAATTGDACTSGVCAGIEEASEQTMTTNVTVTGKSPTKAQLQTAMLASLPTGSSVTVALVQTCTVGFDDPSDFFCGSGATANILANSEKGMGKTMHIYDTANADAWNTGCAMTGSCSPVSSGRRQLSSHSNTVNFATTSTTDVSQYVGHDSSAASTFAGNLVTNIATYAGVSVPAVVVDQSSVSYQNVVTYAITSPSTVADSILESSATSALTTALQNVGFSSTDAANLVAAAQIAVVSGGGGNDDDSTAGATTAATSAGLVVMMASMLAFFM